MFLRLISCRYQKPFRLSILMNILASNKLPSNPFARDKDVHEQTFLNVAYGHDPMQAMDVYLPKGRSAHATKSLVLIHGGGWTGGSKAEFTGHIQSFKSRMPDYAIFNVAYRLVSGGHLFPKQEEDIKAAVDFIVSRSDVYRISKNSLVLLGVSAGAHLALLQAYKYPFPNIRAVVDYFGPADLIAMHQRPWHPLVPLALQTVTGTTPDADPQLFHASSPVAFVGPQSPQTLILHGGKDQVVDVSQSKALAGKLKAAGVKHRLEIYPAEGHGRWYGDALTSSFERIEKFLEEVVP